MFEDIRKGTVHRTVSRMIILSRGWVRYPQMIALPCKVKGCIHKKRNGRCGLEKIELELDENDKLTDRCFMFEQTQKED